MSVQESIAVAGQAPAVVTPQHRWSPGLRVAAAAVVIAGPALQVTEEMLEPRNGDDADRFAWVAANLATFTASKIVGFLAVPVLIGTLLVFALLAWRRAPRLSLAGAALGVLGMSGLAAIQGTEYAVLGGSAASGGDAAQVEALFTALDDSGFATAVFLSMLGGALFGLLLLMVALWMSRAVPRWAPAVIAVFLVVDFLGLVPMAHTILLIGAAGVAYGVIAAKTDVPAH